MKNLRIKKFLSCALAVGMMSSMAYASNGISPFYIDGDREVEYFSMDWSFKENIIDASSKSVQKLYDRPWVVSVNTFENLKYSVGYSMGIANGSADAFSNFIYAKGTGNFGGSFKNINDAIGNYMCLSGLISQYEPVDQYYVSGQFSPDAAK